MLHDAGLPQIVATRGTAEAVQRMGIPCDVINKLAEGSPHIVELIDDGDVGLVVNTPTGSGARSDGWEIRGAAIARGVPCLTTLSGGLAAARAIAGAHRAQSTVTALQDVHGTRASRGRAATTPRPAGATTAAPGS